MTEPEPVNLEYDEIIARAELLEQPIPDPPSENPNPPSRLAMAIQAAADLGFSADNMRYYLDQGRKERENLAESLRNAAKAYEEADEQAAEAVDNTDIGSQA